MTACPNCDANDAADRGDDPWAVARLQTGYVNLAPTQYYRGATFFVAKVCVRELHQLSKPDSVRAGVARNVDSARAAGHGAKVERRQSFAGDFAGEGGGQLADPSRRVPRRH
jgi:hypothetical protein